MATKKREVIILLTHKKSDCPLIKAIPFSNLNWCFTYILLIKWKKYDRQWVSKKNGLPLQTRENKNKDKEGSYFKPFNFPDDYCTQEHHFQFVICKLLNKNLILIKWFINHAQCGGPCLQFYVLRNSTKKQQQKICK
jgi:hypothetical protein